MNKHVNHPPPGVPHALEGYVWEGDAVCVHVYRYGQLVLSSAASPFSIMRYNATPFGRFI